tara:strand:+ start:217 stop:1734 length:1518 start_codon:yes stop_codon:yes gene_type:complete
MPKIPTFTTQARPTAEVGAVKSNIQIPLSQNIGTALAPVTDAIVKYKIKENDIANKALAAQLEADSQLEIFSLKEESKLKTSPEEGSIYFRSGLKQIVSKYSSQAKNKYVKSYYQSSILKEQPTHISAILKSSRDQLVKTRETQVDTKIKRKIFDTVHSGTPFSFSILTQDVLNDYMELEKEGLKGKLDVKTFRENLPAIIETEMVMKIATTNAFAAISSLDDINNFKSIKGEEREKLRTVLRSKAKFQNDMVNTATSQQLLESKKKVTDALKGPNQTYLGTDPTELYKFNTGNIEYDKQIFDYNNKFINKKISLDTDYIVNDKIINKILNSEITDPFQKFSLPGESTQQSITERIGNGSVNLTDDDFFTNIFESQKNIELNKSNKQFFQFINKTIPIIEGSSTSKFFDETYNSRLSSFRQDMHKKFYEGLQKKIPITKLLDAKSEEYIAKDILDYSPTKSVLRNALLNYALSKEAPSEAPVRLKNETLNQWKLRYRQWKISQKK